ncbi:potassium/proton antiporter [Archangium sp.]|uniref:potassium/proton antiporter n=1 Tax=Archangium sp. TaxID=1872627 RepID=UPI00286B97A0|nr:potassium/proton antiporter [Archangium sp.]
MSNEPLATAFLLTAIGVLMGVCALFSRAAGRFGIPVALLFILLGMVGGSEGFGGIEFDDYGLTFRMGTVALVLILFDGGLNTPLAAVREGIRPASVLATLGVLGTAAVMGVAAHFFGFEWKHAFLLGAIVSSTDAAAVFSVLRGSGLHLKRRVGVTLELESGLNDPMAVILTIALTEALVSGKPLGWGILLDALREMLTGAVLGVGLGYASRILLKHVRLPAGGLYPVLTLALAFLAFGLPTLLHGSGFLSVYLCAMLVGNEAIRYRSGLLRVHDAIAWLAQVGMFLMLGLLALPSAIVEVTWSGLGLGLVLAFLARPLVVTLCLLPFRFAWRESLYVGWVGLRGAVPIILATFPVLAQAPGALAVFNVVFFIVVVNALIPGATVGWVTRKLGLVSLAPPPPTAMLELTSTLLLNGELVPFYLDPASAVAGASIADLPLPGSASVSLIVRGNELVTPRGGTTLMPGDHVYIFCKPEELSLVQLLFGEQMQE